MHHLRGYGEGVIQYGICYGSGEGREEEGWSILISAVNVLTCSIDLIALIGSHCALPNEGLRLLLCPLGVGRSENTGVLPV